MPVSIYGKNNPDLEKFMVNEQAIIWRYMSIGRYLDIITHKRLWFNRVVEFRKTDPYEGAPTKFDEYKIFNILNAKTKGDLTKILEGYGEQGIINLMNSNPEKSLYWFQLLFLVRLPYTETNAYVNSVSCWHENSTESDAMWALYAQREAGVAIKSTVNRVVNAFAAATRPMHIAKVAYNLKNDLSAMTSGISDSILIKRQAFAHENEIRIVAITQDGYEAPEWTEKNQVYNIDTSKKVVPGVYVDCDVPTLIEEVVASPLMPDHDYTALEVVSKKFLPNTPIRKSMLLVREELPMSASKELVAMWNHYRKTHRILDFNEIDFGETNKE